ncbi:ATP10 protein-domain-containing protein [Xylariomycetidae sp. FL2044]|nr:ATP10 protein-domain-containing protein [Xylariomycetidae sp. FL2044]
MSSFARQPKLLCLLCRSRAFSTSYRRLAEPAKKPGKTTPNAPSLKPAPQKTVHHSQLENAPRAYGRRVTEFTPTPLTRPIGLPNPPQPGENTGIDSRSLRQRRDDFVDIKKHLERREEMKSQFSRPYFRDWRNMELHRGKTFVSPPRIFKAQHSLYFPNLYGRTLVKGDSQPRDTTPVLHGKVSVVTLFSQRWAQDQVDTFVSPAKNPDLWRVLEANPDRAQLVRVNFESDWMKAALIRLFLGGIRREVGEENWGRYFLVRRELPDEIREHIGVLNHRVGYTYLVDSDCRIRWAASGDSEEHERQGLVKALQRLLDEEKKKDEVLAKNQQGTVPEKKQETVAAS